MHAESIKGNFSYGYTPKTSSPRTPLQHRATTHRVMKIQPPGDLVSNINLLVITNQVEKDTVSDKFALYDGTRTRL